MSVQNAAIARTSNQFFDQLPDDAVRSVFESLKGEDGALVLGGDDRAVIATAAVCRNWQNNPILNEEREEAATRLRQRNRLQALHREASIIREYPREMVRLFRACRTPIEQLPSLDLGNRESESGLIDFLQPAEMNRAVMRFKDLHGRPGIALRIRGNGEGFVQKEWNGEVIPIRNLDNVLAIFKRISDPEHRQWSFEFGNADATIGMLYRRSHENSHIGEPNEPCPTCPFANRQLHPVVLRGLLMGQDPTFILPGHVPPTKGRKCLSERIILVTTTLAAIAIAYLKNYCFTSERSSF